jgi:hypothetical protein
MLSLWSSGTDVRATEFVEKEHCRPARSLIVVAVGKSGGVRRG